MGSVWTFVRKPSNQRLMTYIWPAHQAPTAECIQQGVKIGGSVSGSTVSNSVSGGTATSGPCVDATKK
jgi:hypothetical protein